MKAPAPVLLSARGLGRKFGGLVAVADLDEAGGDPGAAELPDFTCSAARRGDQPAATRAAIALSRRNARSSYTR